MSNETIIVINDDDERKQAGHSARGLASTSSQSLAGIVERLVRPMLKARTLTQEIQPFYCLATFAERSALDQTALTAAARQWIRAHDRFSKWSYSQLCGLDFGKTTLQERIDVTTQLDREEALRREMSAFSAWTEANMYLTVRDAKRSGMKMPVYWLGGKPRSSRNLFTLVWNGEYGVERSLWSVYRLQPGIMPLSHLVVHDMVAICQAMVEDVLQQEVSEQQKKRALDDALTAARTEASKRRKM